MPLFIAFLYSKIIVFNNYINIEINNVSINSNNRKAKIIFNFRKIRNFFVLLLCLSPLIILACLRYNTGADYIQYNWTFDEIYYTSDKISYILNSSEPMYVVSMIFVQLIFGDVFQAWIIIMVLMTFINICAAFTIMDKKFNIFIFTFLFSLYIYLHMFNFVRQFIALSFIFIGIAFLLRKKVIKFLLFIILATLFHRSSIVFVILLFLYIFRNYLHSKIFYIFVILFPFLLIISVSMLSNIPFFSKYYQDYFENDFNIGFGWIIDVIPIVLLYILVLKRNRVNYGDFLLQSSLLIFGFRILSYYAYGAGRLYLDYAFFAICGFSMCINDSKSKGLKIFISSLLFIIYFIFNFYFANASEVFPYSFIFR